MTFSELLYRSTVVFSFLEMNLCCIYTGTCLCVCFKINWQLSFLIPRCCCHVQFFWKDMKRAACTLVICSVCAQAVMSTLWREGWLIRASERLFCLPEELLLHASKVMNSKRREEADQIKQGETGRGATNSTYISKLLTYGCFFVFISFK